ncbi:centriolin-like isoform X2 [Hippocampus comes]|uniref:centriolin-like isoform X2 n=1 Tax=Hippocampus comes TaxID=109280 RepID=UPI00094ED4D6|nr:PREDICTED: centriolin-like isoform X2 [Hippocampus comes]
MKPSDMNARLEDALSRIAVEAQEIQELEQQLTDGQILANELLQKDLEGILGGLQEYLRGLRLKASELQAENENLQRHLEDAQRHRKKLEDTARVCDQMAAQQEALAALKMEAQVLKWQKAGLEAELKEMREELNQQLTLGQKTKTRTSVEQTQQQMARLQDQPDQNRIAQLEERVTQYQNHITQLQEQSSNHHKHIDQLEDQLTRYRKRITQLEDSVAHHHHKCILQPEFQSTATVVSARTPGRGRACRLLGGANGKPKPHADRSVLQLCEEVQCVEQTLHKRRAELREADRRLMHVHARFQSNQAASQHSATTLKQMALRLRVLQDEEAELRRRTRAEHQRLRAVEAELSDREAESQELCTSVHMATCRLAELVRACQEADACLDRTLTQVERARAELHGVEAEHRRLKR